MRYSNNRLSTYWLSILLACLSPALVIAQGTFVSHEADTWYFGRHAGLSFSGGEPVALENSAMIQHEGTAVISDRKTGELLFYTNGQSVWASDHSIMSNGEQLDGHRTSTQTALIVPAPEQPDQYYIFTVGAGTYVNSNNNGFRYSLVDLSLNGGLGRVTQKNVHLLDSTAEKLTATRHCNGRDYWILVHTWGDSEPSSFHAFLLGPNGLEDPFTSSVGTPYRTGDDLQGSFKFSPDGTRLAVTSTGPNRLEFFEFDRETGRVFNRINVAAGASYYGVEFSPSGNRLYTTTLPFVGTNAVLVQFDISTLNPELIKDSETTLHVDGSSWQGAQLQMGPNGRIYASFYGRRHLGVIMNPESLGVSANYVAEGVDLGSGVTEYGLPNFIQANLFFEQTDDAADELTNFPCTPIQPNCPSIDTLLFSIGDYHVGAIGDTLNLSVNLEQMTRNQPISSISVSLEYDKEALLLKEISPQDILAGGVLEGWNVQTFTNNPGSILVIITQASPSTLPGPGRVLSLRFQSFPGSKTVEESPLDLSVDVDVDSCTVVQKDNGSLNIDFPPPGCPSIDTLLFSIGDYHVGAIGDTLNLSVNLEQMARNQPISSISVELKFDQDALLPQTVSPQELVAGGVLQGWDVETFTKAPGTVLVTLTQPSPTTLPGTGNILNLRFRSFLGSRTVEGAPLELSIDIDVDSCTLIQTSNGSISIDTLCGASQRLIELASGYRYALSFLSWDRASSLLGVSLQVGREALTTVEIIDVRGNIVGEIYREELAPGQHNLILDASSLSEGAYFCRVRSGPWMTVKRLLLGQ